METLKQFRIRINLHNFFNDHRKYARIFVNKCIKCIADLEEHIQKIFGISEFYLTCQDQYLPPVEDVRILQPDDELWLWKKSADASGSSVKKPIQEVNEIIYEDSVIEENGFAEKKRKRKNKNVITEGVDEEQVDKKNKDIENEKPKKKKKKHKIDYAEYVEEPEVSSSKNELQKSDKQFIFCNSTSTPMLKNNNENLKESLKIHPITVVKKLNEEGNKIYTLFTPSNVHPASDSAFSRTRETYPRESDSLENCGTVVVCNNKLENPTNEKVIKNEVFETDIDDMSVWSEISTRKSFSYASSMGSLVNQLRNSFDEASATDDAFITKRKRKRVRKRKQKSSNIFALPTEPNNGYEKFEFKPPKTVAAPLLHVRFTQENDIEISNEQTNETENNARSTGVIVETESPLPSMEILRVTENIVKAENILKCPLMTSLLPREKDIISFKILIISESYTPEISDFIICQVLNYNPDDETVKVLVLSGGEQLYGPKGKFYIENPVESPSETPENDDSEKIFVWKWKEVLEPRLIFP